MTQRIALLLGFLTMGLSCGRLTLPVRLALSFGPYGFNASDLMACPGGGGTVPVVPCGGCPLGTSCVGGNCDPDPFPFERQSPPLDLLSDPAITSTLSVVRSFLIEDAEYCIESCLGTPLSNTLNFDIPALELYWGPGDAVDTLDARVRRLGVTPIIRAMSRQSGTIVLNPTGVQELSNYVVDPASAGTVRYFARGAVDIDPGDACPMGAIEFKINLRVLAEGDPIGAAGG